MWVPWQTIGTRTIGFWNLFYPTVTRNTDRLTQESLLQNLSDFRKSLNVQRRVAVRWGFCDAGFGLLSGATWFRRSGEQGFDQWRMHMIPNFGDPSGQRHVGGRHRDTHTAEKVLTHGHTLLFFRYSHFSLVRTISGKEKILYYRELLVSEKFFKTPWIPLVLPSPVILGEKKFLLSRITG